jgi:hypothetical protein
LTGESAVIRQTPAWPPLKVVNMRASKLGTGRGTSAVIGRSRRLWTTCFAKVAALARVLGTMTLRQARFFGLAFCCM